MSGILSDKIHKSSSFIDEQFNKEGLSSYHLLVQSGSEGLNLAVLDTKRNKYLALESFQFQSVSHPDLVPDLIEQAFLESKIISPKYPKVSFILNSPLSTLVPDALFDKDRMKAYLKFNTELEGDELILHDSIKPMNAHHVFALPIGLKMKMDSYFHSVNYFHSGSGIISSILQQAKNKNKKQLTVHVQSSHVDILVTDANQLLFFNSFRYQTPEDLLYYLLFVAEQLELNPELIETIVLGEVEKNSAIVGLIKKYVKEVEMGSRTDESELSYQLQTLPKHFYFSLLNPYFL